MIERIVAPGYVIMEAETEQDKNFLREITQGLNEEKILAEVELEDFNPEVN